MDKLTEEWTKLDNKVRFILAVVKEEIIIRNRKRADLLKELQGEGIGQQQLIFSDKKFLPFDSKNKRKKSKAGSASTVGFFTFVAEVEDDEELAQEEVPDEVESKSAYDYLLSMPLWSLTLEKVECQQNSVDMLG